jgi:hypothetical protein
MEYIEYKKSRRKMKFRREELKEDEVLKRGVKGRRNTPERNGGWWSKAEEGGNWIICSRRGMKGRPGIYMKYNVIYRVFDQKLVI